MVPDGATDVAAAVAAPTVVQDPAHDLAHAPINCPVRRHGINPTGLRPFEEVEAYIAFLNRPDRGSASWYPPPPRDGREAGRATWRLL